MILIFGASGYARETEAIAQAAGVDVLAFVDRDDAPLLGSSIRGRPVITLSDAIQTYPQASCVISIGAPRIRALVAAEAVAAGFKPRTLIHPSVCMSQTVTIGEGSVLFAGAVLTCDITLGKHVLINSCCSIGHDVVMGDCSNLSPGARVSGYVHIGEQANIGAGATIINGHPGHPLTIGAGAVVGAQACIIRDVAPGSTVIGVPAKPMKSA